MALELLFNKEPIIEISKILYLKTVKQLTKFVLQAKQKPYWFTDWFFQLCETFRLSVKVPSSLFGKLYSVLQDFLRKDKISDLSPLKLGF